MVADSQTDWEKMSSKRRFGKSTLVNDSFIAAAKLGQSAKYESLDYVCFSRKAWEEQKEAVKKELSHQATEILEQVEREVIGEVELAVMPRLPGSKEDWIAWHKWQANYTQRQALQKIKGKSMTAPKLSEEAGVRRRILFRDVQKDGSATVSMEQVDEVIDGLLADQKQELARKIEKLPRHLYAESKDGKTMYKAFDVDDVLNLLKEKRV